MLMKAVLAGRGGREPTSRHERTRLPRVVRRSSGPCGHLRGQRPCRFVMATIVFRRIAEESQ